MVSGSLAGYGILSFRRDLLENKPSIGAKLRDMTQ